MNKFTRIGAPIALALSFAACDDGIIDTSDTSTNGTEECMFATDGETPDILPGYGDRLTSVDDSVYSACEVYTGDILIHYTKAATCAAGSWNYQMEHRGPSSGAMLVVHDSAGGSSNTDAWWGEEHPIASGTSGPSDWYETYALDLNVVATPGAVNPGSTTLHACEANDSNTLVYGYEVYAKDDPTQVVDCVILSPSTTTDGFIDEFLTAFPRFDGCAEIEGWLDNDVGN